eukprot:s3094_g4.t1
MYLDDKTRTPSANEILNSQRPVLSEFTDADVRDHFIEGIRQIEPSIPESKIQALLHILGASDLLEHVDFTRVESLFLPKTTSRAVAIRLSHIPRFEEKPAFLNKANISFAMIHGTNIIGAKYALAEALVRPADWTYCETLSKCEQPTYGCFALGSCITSREGEIPNWNLAGGNDMAQLQCALTGVVTTAEKYTVARSEHCTIRCLIVVWPDLSFIQSREGQSASYHPADSKDNTKDTPDDTQDDRAPDPDSLRSWRRRGGNTHDEEDF